MKSYEAPNFIKFDTIKIRTKIDYFKKETLTFNVNNHPRNGYIEGKSYSAIKDNKIPYNLFIGINYFKQSMTIEFSSKILLDDYPKLITKNTFKQCLDNLNKLGICEIDAESISKDCYLSIGHIASDHEMDLTDGKLDTLNTLVDQYRRYKWKHYEKTGYIFSKDTKEKKGNETFRIYDKETEILEPKNEKFVSLLQNPEKIRNYFEKYNVRFEFVLDKDNIIKDYLNIPDTHIDNVFNSKANPLLLQFNKIFGTDELRIYPYINTPDKLLIKNTLELYKHDLKKIEMSFRPPIYNSRSGRTKKMNLFKEISHKILNEKPIYSTVLAEIREKLEGSNIYK